MKQKWIPLKTKLPYIYEYLFGSRTPKQINKEIYNKHLTISKNYSGRKQTGGLAIYLWTYNFLNLDYNMKKVFYTKHMSETEKQELERLRKENSKLRKQNHEYEEVIRISKELIKEYIPKKDKEKLKNSIKKCSPDISISKILKYFGFPKSTYYHKNKPKVISERKQLIYYMILMLYDIDKYFDCCGRMKLLPLLNALCNRKGYPTITEWELRSTMNIYGIKANLIHKKHRYVDPKNTKCKYEDLICGDWYSDEPGKKLFTDVTYLPDGEDFIYISTIIDSYDFKPIGHAASKRNDTKLVIESLNSIERKIDGAILHSDHGATYSSKEYEEWCEKHNIKISMGRVGKSLDNYPIEHHWANVKMECLWKIPLEKRTLTYVRRELEKYYDWFNNFRISSTNSNVLFTDLYNLANKSCPTFAS